MLESRCLEQSIEFQIGTDAFANSIAVRFLPLILLFLTSNTVLDATYLVDLHSTTFYIIALEFLGRPGLLEPRSKGGDDSAAAEMGKEGMGKVHGLGAGLRVLAKDDPSSSGCIHYGTAGFCLEGGHGAVEVVGCLTDGTLEVRGPQVIVQPGLCTVFQDMEQTMGNDYCIDTMYRHPASKGMVSSKQQGVLLKCGV
ncbi:hypothetical protein IW261DRAFT_1420273 [Armillaria novae-zelandiae]|uniref:Uncharacterized protein n=1 Tax=Armillaria novae-zelandiae TaxID=153914 RepID=A0AA39P7B6_9AGAR|nr:hypothetical protein IW261DRAFT_1420273 [Armillaria novae-zelandiae]